MYLAFDIGGTAIKYAVFNSRAELVKKYDSLDTNLYLKDKSVLCDVIDDVLKHHSINGIAISSAGVIDPNVGVVQYAGPTMPGYSLTSFKKEIIDKYQLSCVVENDVNAAAVGELYLGALKGINSGVMLTLGTGIGGALILDGKLYRGSSNTAGEVGYMSLGFQNFQKMASTRTLVDSVCSFKNEELDGKEVIGLLEKNDKFVVSSVKQLMYNLAQGIANINYVFNPETFVLGGGIMESYTILKPFLDEALNDVIGQDVFRQFTVKPAQLGNMAGMVGVVCLLLEEIQ